MILEFESLVMCGKSVRHPALSFISTNMTRLVYSLAAKTIEDLGVFGYQRISLARGVESNMDKLQCIMSKIITV